MLYTFGIFSQLFGISNLKHFQPDQNTNKFKNYTDQTTKLKIKNSTQRNFHYLILKNTPSK